MSETTPLIKAALNLRVGVGFDVYVKSKLSVEDLVWIIGKNLSLMNLMLEVGLGVLTMSFCQNSM